MSGPAPVGRRAFVAGAGAALVTGGARDAAQAAVVDGPLPGFHPALKDELTFPLAWGRSPVRDFRAWRRAARAKVEELLVVDRDEHTPYDPQSGGHDEADGFTRALVTLSLTRHERVRGALLTPHGPGPFPAVLLLHDHGARFDIGKEKLVRPWYDDTRLASAQAWADRCFSGRFVGDELARRGYVVLALDALGWADRGPITYDSSRPSPATSTTSARRSPGSWPGRTPVPPPSWRASTRWMHAGSPPSGSRWAPTVPGRPPPSATTSPPRRACAG